MCVRRSDSSGLMFSSLTNLTTMLPRILCFQLLLKRFFYREIKAADAARAFYRKLGRPYEAAFRSLLVRRIFIHNCPVTADDAQRALTIYGPDVATLKGKWPTPVPPRALPRSRPSPFPPHPQVPSYGHALC